MEEKKEKEENDFYLVESDSDIGKRKEKKKSSQALNHAFVLS